ncbi:MAG: pyruvate kinase [Firmicutes bacterium]|nr:pyruvate kinase [Bacillota bacterium]
MTKIICTIGPASNTPEMIEKMVHAGMSITRVNCSHGNEDSIRAQIKSLKQIRVDKKLDFEIMLDTKGPDVRIGTFKDGQIELCQGDQFILTTTQCEGDNTRVFVNCETLPERVKPGQILLLNDGLIRATVTTVKGNDVVTKIEQGGVLSNRKTMFAPNCDLGLPFLSDADKADLRIGVEEGVDMIAASFVGSKKDVEQMQSFLVQCGKNIPIVAKIESSDGIANIDEILANVMGMMVARGDLGVEYPLEQIPGLQKFLVEKTLAAGKFAVVATEMMESMINKPRPTRAEVTDVANAVWQGAHAVMLSAESAVGKFPLDTVQFMKRIATEAEKSRK